MPKRDRREKRKSAARRRVAEHTLGVETSILRMPEGLSFWVMKEGTHKIDIVPYKCGKGNPFCDEGEEYYERTFWIYRRIGAAEKAYVCPSKTFGERDPIAEARAKMAKEEDADQDAIKALLPKERQLFLVHDHADMGNLYLWEVSHHTFGKLLDSRIDNSTEDEGWDLFYCSDEDGMTLRVTIEEQSAQGFKFLNTTAIDFLQRGPLDDAIKNHGICLDDLLVKKTYEELYSIFHHVVEDDKSDDSKEEVATQVEESKQPPPPEDKYPTADQFGLSRGDEVMYNGNRCTILKISGDGTSLTLNDEDADKVETAIGPEQVIKGWEKVEEKKEVEKEPVTVSGSEDDDDDWSF